MATFAVIFEQVSPASLAADGSWLPGQIDALQFNSADAMIGDKRTRTSTVGTYVDNFGASKTVLALKNEVFTRINTLIRPNNMVSSTSQIKFWTGKPLNVGFKTSTALWQEMDDSKVLSDYGYSDKFVNNGSNKAEWYQMMHGNMIICQTVCGCPGKCTINTHIRSAFMGVVGLPCMCVQGSCKNGGNCNLGTSKCECSSGWGGDDCGTWTSSSINRLSVDCLLTLPTYDRPKFISDAKADVKSRFDFSNINPNTTTVDDVRQLIYSGINARVIPLNVPMFSDIKLYTGGFLKADSKTVGGGFFEMQGSRTLASYGYIPNPGENEIICVTSPTCAGYPCGANGTCKVYSAVSGGNTGWYYCECTSGYQGWGCTPKYMLNQAIFFITSAPVSKDINNFAVYQYGMNPTPPYGGRQLFIARDIIHSYMTIKEIKNVIATSFPKNITNVSSSRLTLWTGNGIGAWDNRVDKSAGKPWTAMEDGRTLFSYGYVDTNASQTVVVTIACDESCTLGCDIFGACTCSVLCKNGGTCGAVDGKCICQPGWGGDDCGTCTKQCSNRGECNSMGQCVCQSGWGGADCGTCTKQCSNRGACNSMGQCVCQAGWGGADCETCTTTCKNGGTCSSTTGKCQCVGKWTGDDCGVCSCKNGGQCSNETGECECPTGWGGDDCGMCTRTCVNGGACSSDNTCACPVQKVCNGKGTCDAFNGACACQDGWTGADCSIPPPPPPLPPRYVCSSNGTCLTMKADVGGVSFSDIKSCREQCCPSVNGQVCSGSGVCTNGACVCAKGKTGRACELQDCSVNTSCGMCSGAGCAWCPSTKKCEMPSSANAKTCPIKKGQCCEAPPAAGCFAPLSYRTGCAPDAAKGIVECSSSVTKDPSQTCCLSSEVSTLSTAACPAGWTADVSKDYCQTSINPLSPKYRVKCKRVCP